jgi:hypothetical protein
MTRLAAIIASAAFAVGLYAQGPEGRAERQVPEALISYLKLSETQVTALQENNQAMREEIRTIMQSARNGHEGVREELKQDNPNPAIVGQALVDAKETREAIDAKRDEFRVKALAILTADQKASLESLQQALQLAPTARQAVGTNLLDAPEGGRMGPGRRGGPRRGFHGRPSRGE